MYLLLKSAETNRFLSVLIFILSQRIQSDSHENKIRFVSIRSCHPHHSCHDQQREKHHQFN